MVNLPFGVILDVYENQESSRYVSESRDFVELRQSAKIELSRALPLALQMLEQRSGSGRLQIQFVDMGTYDVRCLKNHSSFYRALAQIEPYLRAFQGGATVTICGKFKKHNVLAEAAILQEMFDDLQISFSSLFFDPCFAETARVLLDRKIGVQVMFDFKTLDRKLFVKQNEVLFDSEMIFHRCNDLHRDGLPVQFHCVSIDQQGTLRLDDRLLTRINHFAATSGCSVAYSGGIDLNFDHRILHSRYPNIRNFFIGNSVVRHLSIASTIAEASHGTV